MTSQTQTNDVFSDTRTFADLGVQGDVLKGIQDAGFEHPTLIQEQLIPIILRGEDVIGQAKTGTGKTAAFALPLLQRADPSQSMQGLILVPTRELAAQVATEINLLGQFTDIRAACIIGGESMRKQKQQVSEGGHLIVGTPGRIMDLRSRGDISFDHIRFAVLDEVDRMLDIGFRDDIRRILKSIDNEHQTVFVSATISEEIEKLGRRFLKPDAQKIVVRSQALTVDRVDQKYISVQPWDKLSMLLFLLQHEQLDTAVVFCRTKATVRKVTERLRKHKIDAREIHGDLDQKKRNRVMERLRKGNLNVLVASDLAARGLDVEHITHVINYDLPEDPEIYIHRIGRTARAGRQGIAWSFVTSEEGQRLTDIEKLAGVLIEARSYPEFKPGPIPDDVAAGARPRSNASAPAKSPTAIVAGRASGGDIDERFAHLSEEELKRMFPSGKIPKKAPRSSLASRFRTRRG